MRRLIPVVLAVALVGMPACKRSKKARVQTVEEESPQLLTVLNTGDPKAAVQLLKGFHEIETDGWRWTKGAFSATLRTPPGAAQKGAKLEFKFTLPDAVLSKTGPVTLKAKIMGVELDPQTYDKAGEYVFERDIPGSSLQGEAVTIDFELSKFLAAGQVEQRELGVIASTIGLMQK